MWVRTIAVGGSGSCLDVCKTLDVGGIDRRCVEIAQLAAGLFEPSGQHAAAFLGGARHRRGSLLSQPASLVAAPGHLVASTC